MASSCDYQKIQPLPRHLRHRADGPQREDTVVGIVPLPPQPGHFRRFLLSFGFILEWQSYLHRFAGPLSIVDTPRRHVESWLVAVYI